MPRSFGIEQSNTAGKQGNNSRLKTFTTAAIRTCGESVDAFLDFLFLVKATAIAPEFANLLIIQKNYAAVLEALGVYLMPRRGLRQRVAKPGTDAT